MLKIWILSSNAPDNETAIDRKTIVSEGILGGQYENIKLLDEFRKAQFKCEIINPNIINNDNIPDIAILRAIDGPGIKKIRSLENLGIKYINNFEAHIECADKPKQLEILSNSGIDIPKTQIVDLPFDDNILDQINFPIVVKPISSQRGELVELCENPEDVYIHCNRIKARFSYQKKVIFQERVNAPIIVVWVIGGIPVDAQIRYPKENTKFFISNHRDNAIRLQYPINNILYDMITQVTKLLNLEIAKIDIFKTNEGYKICEVNSPGGFSGRDEYHNTNHARDIVEYIKGVL